MPCTFINFREYRVFFVRPFFIFKQKNGARRQNDQKAGELAIRTILFYLRYMEKLENLHIKEQSDYVRKIISSYVDAKLIVVNSRNDIGNKIALSKWNMPDTKNCILLPRTISINEQLSAIFQIMATGASSNIPQLSKLGDTLLGSPSKFFLKYLILHEVAHIRNNWRQNREIDCHLWAFEMLEMA